MKNIWGKILAIQAGVLTLVLLVHLVSAILGQQSQEARFIAAGQMLAASVAQTCDGSPTHHGDDAQASLDATQKTPGALWACITAPDGQILAHTRDAQIPTPLLRWLASTGAPWIEVPRSPKHAALTVFRKSVGTKHVGFVYVALDRALAKRAAVRQSGLIAAFVFLIVLLGAGLSARLLWQSLDPLRLVIQAARRIEGEPQASLQLIPITGSDIFNTVASAVNGMLSALWKHFADTHQEGAKYRSLFENAGRGLWQSTLQGQYLCLNPAMAKIYGYATTEELRPLLENQSVFVSANRRAEFLRLMREVGSVTDFESQIRRGDGTTAWISETVQSVRDPLGELHCWQGNVEDVTSRKRTETDQAHLGTYLRLLLESSGEGIYGVDAQGNCTFINVAGAHLLGYQPNDILGRSMHALIHHSHADSTLYPEERSYLYQSVQTGQRFRVDDEVLWRKDGNSFPAEYTTSPLIEGGRTAGAVVTFVDITARKAMETEQKRLLTEALERADHDPLTGLLNHRAFHKRLQEEADRAQRVGADLAVVLLDIDNFKFFNDVYGHKVGDEVLCLVADTLRAGSRSYDVIARFGGDEFAILLPCQGGETAGTLAQQLNQRLAGANYRLPGLDVRIPLGLSVGVAVFPTETPTRIEALEVADERLRRAKTGGDEDGYAERVRNTLTSEREGFSMLDALVTAVDNKDRYTRRHSEDVMRYGVQIAQQLGLDDATQRLVEVAALVHDVGKIGVPDSILRKPGQLTDEEFDAVRQHPIMGAVIAEAIPGFEETLEVVRHHHERWDGKGYPSELAGEDIPFLARLMAVADSYSAMTTDRPYRKGMDRTKALGILEQGAGVQWDPNCVAAFLRAQEYEPA